MSKPTIQSPSGISDISFEDTSKRPLSDSKSIWNLKDESKVDKTFAQGPTISRLELTTPVKLEDLALLNGSESMRSAFSESRRNYSQIKIDKLSDSKDELQLSSHRTNRDNLLQVETPNVSRDLSFLRSAKILISPPESQNLNTPTEYCFESLVETPMDVVDKRKRKTQKLFNNLNVRNISQNTFTDFMQNQGEDSDRPPISGESKNSASLLGVGRVNSFRRQSAAVSQNKVRSKDSESALTSIELDGGAKDKRTNRLETLKEENEGGTIRFE